MADICSIDYIYKFGGLREDVMQMHGINMYNVMPDVFKINRVSEDVVNKINDIIRSSEHYSLMYNHYFIKNGDYIDVIYYVSNDYLIAADAKTGGNIIPLIENINNKSVFDHKDNSKVKVGSFVSDKKGNDYIIINAYKDRYYATKADNNNGVYIRTEDIKEIHGSYPVVKGNIILNNGYINIEQKKIFRSNEDMFSVRKFNDLFLKYSFENGSDSQVYKIKSGGYTFYVRKDLDRVLPLLTNKYIDHLFMMDKDFNVVFYDTEKGIYVYTTDISMDGFITFNNGSKADYYEINRRYVLTPYIATFGIAETKPIYDLETIKVPSSGVISDSMLYRLINVAIGIVNKIDTNDLIGKDYHLLQVLFSAFHNIDGKRYRYDHVSHYILSEDKEGLKVIADAINSFIRQITGSDTDRHFAYITNADDNTDALSIFISDEEMVAIIDSINNDYNKTILALADVLSFVNISEIDELNKNVLDINKDGNRYSWENIFFNATEEDIAREIEEYRRSKYFKRTQKQKSDVLPTHTRDDVQNKGFLSIEDFIENLKRFFDRIQNYKDIIKSNINSITDYILDKKWQVFDIAKNERLFGILKSWDKYKNHLGVKKFGIDKMFNDLYELSKTSLDVFKDISGSVIQNSWIVRYMLSYDDKRLYKEAINFDDYNRMITEEYNKLKSHLLFFKHSGNEVVEFNGEYLTKIDDMFAVFDSLDVSDAFKIIFIKNIIDKEFIVSETFNKVYIRDNNINGISDVFFVNSRMIQWLYESSGFSTNNPLLDYFTIYKIYHKIQRMDHLNIRNIRDILFSLPKIKQEIIKELKDSNKYSHASVPFDIDNVISEIKKNTSGAMTQVLSNIFNDVEVLLGEDFVDMVDDIYYTTNRRRLPLDTLNKVKGLFDSKSNKILIKGDELRSDNTLYHELVHRVLKNIKESPQVYKEIESKIKELLEYIKENTDIYDKIREEYTSDKTDDEALVRYISDIIEGKMQVIKDNVLLSKIKDIIDTILSYIKNLVGLYDKSIEEIKNMSVQEFADVLANTVLKEEIKKSKFKSEVVELTDEERVYEYIVDFTGMFRHRKNIMLLSQQVEEILEVDDTFANKLYSSNVKEGHKRLYISQGGDTFYTNYKDAAKEGGDIKFIDVPADEIAGRDKIKKSELLLKYLDNLLPFNDMRDSLVNHYVLYLSEVSNHPIVTEGFSDEYRKGYDSSKYGYFTPNYDIVKIYEDGGKVKMFVIPSVVEGNILKESFFKAYDFESIYDIRRREQEFINNNRGDVIVLSNNNNSWKEDQYAVKKGITLIEIGSDENINNFTQWREANINRIKDHNDKSVVSLTKKVANAINEKMEEQLGTDIFFNIETDGSKRSLISTYDNPIQLYSDGSDIKGTGQIGYGAVYVYEGKVYALSGTEDSEEVKKLSELFPDVRFSNPTMEMLALVKVLETFMDTAEHIVINQDYKGAVNYRMLWYASEGSQQRDPKPWNVKEKYIEHLVERAERAIDRIKANGGSVRIRWVKGHAGDKMNELADSYAKSREHINTLIDPVLIKRNELKSVKETTKVEVKEKEQAKEATGNIQKALISDVDSSKPNKTEQGIVKLSNTILAEVEVVKSVLANYLDIKNKDLDIFEEIKKFSPDIKKKIYNNIVLIQTLKDSIDRMSDLQKKELSDNGIDMSTASYISLSKFVSNMSNSKAFNSPEMDAYLLLLNNMVAVLSDKINSKLGDSGENVKMVYNSALKSLFQKIEHINLERMQVAKVKAQPQEVKEGPKASTEETKPVKDVSLRFDIKEGSKVFISGSRAIKELSDVIKKKIDELIDKEVTIYVGDADGVDTLVQNYLNEKGYKNVVVTYVLNKPRNLASKDFKTIKVETKEKTDSWAELFAVKDKYMTFETDYSVVIWDGKSRGSLNNIERAQENGKGIKVYSNEGKELMSIPPKGQIEIKKETKQVIELKAEKAETEQKPTEKTQEESIIETITEEEQLLETEEGEEEELQAQIASDITIETIAEQDTTGDKIIKDVPSIEIQITETKPISINDIRENEVYILDSDKILVLSISDTEINYVNLNTNMIGTITDISKIKEYINDNKVQNIRKDNNTLYFEYNGNKHTINLKDNTYITEPIISLSEAYIDINSPFNNFLLITKLHKILKNC